MHTHTHIPTTNSYELNGLGFEFFRGKILIVRPNRPHRNLVPTCHLINEFRGSFPGVKLTVWEGDHPSTSSADVKMSGVITLTKVRFHGVNRENLTVYTYTNVCISTAECAK